jgi:hypothetical protein
MNISLLRDYSKSSDAPLAAADTPPAPAAETSIPLGQQESEKDQRSRRRKAYKWYKHYAKPTKASMCSIVEHYANDSDCDITRQDVDLLPWNLEETEVIKEATRSSKKDTEKKDIVESNDFNKRPTLVRGQMGDSLKSLEILLNNSSSSSLDFSSSSLDFNPSSREASSSKLDASSSKLDASWNPLITIQAKVEYKRRKEERRLKRETAEKKSEPEVKMQGKRTANGTNSEDDRRERAFHFYANMVVPNRTEFKRRAAAAESSHPLDITPEDIDLLPWKENGRVVDIKKMCAIIRARVLLGPH